MFKRPHRTKAKRASFMSRVASICIIVLFFFVFFMGWLSFLSYKHQDSTVLYPIADGKNLEMEGCFKMSWVFHVAQSSGHNVNPHAEMM